MAVWTRGTMGATFGRLWAGEDGFAKAEQSARGACWVQGKPLQLLNPNSPRATMQSVGICFHSVNAAPDEEGMLRKPQVPSLILDAGPCLRRSATQPTGWALVSGFLKPCQAPVSYKT